MSPVFRPRQSILTYPDRLRRMNLSLIYGFDLAYGALFAFGGKADSPSQVVLRQALPGNDGVQLWGAFLVLASVAAWVGYGERGGLGCLVAWSAMAIASAVAIAQGNATSWGGPLIFGLLMGLHIITVYGVTSGHALRAPK